MYDNDDHRSVAQRLDLFHLQDDAPGMVFWHPRGFVLVRILEDAVREHLAAFGYDEVRSPQILRRAIWEASGHWEHFRDGMFRVQDQACEAAVKPVSYPGHLQILLRRVPSYRELPIRLAEFGLVHRDEQGGALHGLLRLRQFVQDDGHVFCLPEQAEQEVEGFCRAVPPFYAAFGFRNLSVALSLRPASRARDDESWDRAESALIRVLERWGQKQPLVMLHRALHGSLERLLGILLEQHGASLPAWLAPEQVVVVPVSPDHRAQAQRVAAALRQARLRVRVDGRPESLARRVADAHGSAIPFIAVVGPKEAKDDGVSLRERTSKLARSFEQPSLVSFLVSACARPEA